MSKNGYKIETKHLQNENESVKEFKIISGVDDVHFSGMLF